MIKHSFLKKFHINHVFIVDESGNRNEVDVENKRIVIKHHKVNLSKYLRDKKINWFCININKKDFLEKLYDTTWFIQGKKYHLFWRNCYKLLKYITGYNMLEVRRELRT